MVTAQVFPRLPRQPEQGVCLCEQQLALSKGIARPALHACTPTPPLHHSMQQSRSQCSLQPTSGREQATAPHLWQLRPPPVEPAVTPAAAGLQHHGCSCSLTCKLTCCWCPAQPATTALTLPVRPSSSPLAQHSSSRTADRRGWQQQRGAHAQQRYQSVAKSSSVQGSKLGWCRVISCQWLRAWSFASLLAGAASVCLATHLFVLLWPPHLASVSPFGYCSPAAWTAGNSKHTSSQDMHVSRCRLEWLPVMQSAA